MISSKSILEKQTIICSGMTIRHMILLSDGRIAISATESKCYHLKIINDKTGKVDISIKWMQNYYYPTDLFQLPNNDIISIG